MLRQWPSTWQRPCSNSRSRMGSGVVSRQRLNRGQFTRFLGETAPNHMVMEACGMAHDWSRVAQQHGHRVTLIPAAYVRP
jgi:transposase